MTHGIDGHARPGRLDGAIAAEIAETMQALATPSRVRILGRLREGPCSVTELAEEVEMESSAVSHQLRVLRHLDLVAGRRRGRTVIYALHDSHVADLIDQAIFHVEHVHIGDAESVSAA